MSATAGSPRPASAAFPAIPLRQRIYGFGSIFGKTLRDSRLSFIIAAGLFGALPLALGAALPTVFGTPEARKELDKLVGSMPSSMVNLFGNATLMGPKLGTLGGYMTWKYGAVFTLGAGVWSILALSGTLAGEAAKGSLDFVAVTTFGKRRIALEKLAAHLTLLWLTLVVMAVMVTVSSNTFGVAAQGDQIPPANAFGYAFLVGCLATCFGGLAWALAPVLGRAGAAGVAGISMMVLWVMNGLDIGGPLLLLSPFHWTNASIPLIGLFDWPGTIATGILAIAFLALGVELFGRRDLGTTAGLSLPGLPKVVLGVRGPTSRAFGDQLPRAISWGLGMGLMGAVLASLVGPFAASIKGDSTLTKTFASIFPGYDFTTAGGWLQLYVELFYIAAGFAAATFVSKWASDETGRRLEEVLAAPLTRFRWVLTGGIAALLGVVVMSVVTMLGIGLGASSGGATGGDAILGSTSLGLYAAAFVGVGVAVGGLWRTSLAAEITALVVVATYLVALLAPPLNLPDWVHQLALSTHYGMPMIGRWDAVGVIASVAIAGGGILVGAWGMSRRDVRD